MANLGERTEVTSDIYRRLLHRYTLCNDIKPIG